MKKEAKRVEIGDGRLEKPENQLTLIELPIKQLDSLISYCCYSSGKLGTNQTMSLTLFHIHSLLSLSYLSPSLSLIKQQTIDRDRSIDRISSQEIIIKSK